MTPDSTSKSVTGKLVRPDAARLEGNRVKLVRFLRGDSVDKHYPAEARRAGIDGSVVVDLLINDIGLVQEAQVITEAPQGHGFGLAALDAAKTFEFDNTLRKPVLMSWVIEFLP
jgi:TonB family protein